MKNIVAFIDFKAGKLSARSWHTLSLVQAIQNSFETKPSVCLYSFDDILDASLPTMHNANLYRVDGLNVSGLLTSKQIDFLLDKFITDNSSCIIGYKSAFTDVIFSEACIRLNLPIVPQVVKASIHTGSFDLTQNIYSGKAVSCLTISTSCVIQLNQAFEFPSTDNSSFQLKSQPITLPQEIPYDIHEVVSNSIGGISLVDAAFVVGAGRGLKDPGNWKMIEDLATKIGAATACSKPVSDINWRPHSEHVGQTGIKIAPKLYIACGISGAIQHLAGVNSSKTIIAINNDPEAPFFNYADYGIVGDVFDVIPEIVKNI